MLLGIILAAMTGSLSWDERGCCDITNACIDRKEYEETYKELYDQSLEIDAIYNAGNWFDYLRLFCYFHEFKYVDLG